MRIKEYKTNLSDLKGKLVEVKQALFSRYIQMEHLKDEKQIDKVREEIKELEKNYDELSDKIDEIETKIEAQREKYREHNRKK